MPKTCRAVVPFFVVSLAVSALASTPAGAADFAMILKTGTVRLWDSDQRLDSVERRFDTDSHRTFGVAWEIRNAKEVALGMEYLTFSHDYAPSLAGHARTQAWMFTAKKYFSPGPVLHPFVGLGMGWGQSSRDDGLGNTDWDINIAMQAMAGMEFRIGKNFGLYTEIKGLASDSDGEKDNEFDFSGTAFLAGISMIF